MSELKIHVHGAGGRMGRAVIAAASERPGLVVVAATESAGSSLLGSDAGELAGIGRIGVDLSCDLDAALEAADVAIDFTRPEGTLALLSALGERPRSLVTGTTGLGEADDARLGAAASRMPVVQAANFSVGVNLCLKLVEIAGRVLGDSADIEVIEAHHRHKVDAPSGTALALGRAVADAAGIDLERHAVKARDGITGPRPERAIGFATVRAGDIVGEHTVLFAAPGERVEITHRATSRANFAHGALTAALWLQGREPGRYEMTDVLGL